MLYSQDVRQPYVLLEGVSAQHVDELPYDVHYVVDLLVARLAVGQVYAYYAVDSRGPGQVGREIVARASVHEHHPVRPDRLEQSGDGHGGAHRGIQGAGAPVPGLPGDHVCGHADERHREVGERKAVLPSYGQARQQIVDIETVCEAGRERTQESLPPVSGLFRHSAVEHLAGGVEGNGDHIARIVHLHRVGDVDGVHIVGEHHVPVLAAEELFELAASVADGVHASEHSAYARAADEVHRQSDFLEIFQRADLCGPLRAASRQHEADGRPAFAAAYVIHAGAHLAEECRIGSRSHAVHGQSVGIFLGGGSEGAQQHHSRCECRPASIPQAAMMS